MTGHLPINQAKAALRRGELVAVAEINQVFSPVVVDLIALAGYTCLWIDMEHSAADFGSVSNMLLAASAAGLDAVVRMPHGPYNQAIKTLELGVSGLIWPHCKSAEEARRFVHMAKFRPLGLRGIGGGRDSQFGAAPRSAYLDWANEQTLLGVMIEDREAVEAAEAIAAVEGIDLLFVGPVDLAHSYGLEREPGPPVSLPPILEAFERVGAACRAHGKAMGTAVDPGAPMRMALEMGARWLNCSRDTTALLSGYGQARQATLEIAATARP
jgi:4-hydroxy-2-oxoheptanedioate aldolase